MGKIGPRAWSMHALPTILPHGGQMANNSENIVLRAADGQELGAYVAWPESDPIAGLVVIQEIFGVNAHIRRVTDGYAKDGFLAIAPALFDRIEPGVDLGYEGEDAARARSF